MCHLKKGLSQEIQSCYSLIIDDILSDVKGKCYLWIDYKWPHSRTSFCKKITLITCKTEQRETRRDPQNVEKNQEYDIPEKKLRKISVNSAKLLHLKWIQ